MGELITAPFVDRRSRSITTIKIMAHSDDVGVHHLWTGTFGNSLRGDMPSMGSPGYKHKMLTNMARITHIVRCGSGGTKAIINNSNGSDDSISMVFSSIQSNNMALMEATMNSAWNEKAVLDQRTLFTSLMNGSLSYEF
jgi:hypothetical protein